MQQIRTKFRPSNTCLGVLTVCLNRVEFVKEASGLLVVVYLGNSSVGKGLGIVGAFVSEE